jgi:poly-beta-1,6-N-acetyl-D-glucosamine synthase
MKWLFWLSAGVILYTYAGYAAWLWLRASWRARPVKRAPITPLLSVVMVVRNEEVVLKDKLQNLLQLDYPPERLQIVVVSDGSTDRTEQILREYAPDPRVTAVLNQLSRGKACGLNDGIESAQGEIILFTDARQKLERESARLLVENFADPDVGCASGELMLGSDEAGEGMKGLGLYWRVEKRIREWESESSSVVGATGAIYAVRRNLLVPVPTGTLLDDVYIPMSVIRRRSRVIFDSRARAWDSPDLGGAREFSRKVRTLNGNYQLLQIAPWLLSGSNSLRFEFVSHKLLRLAAPFALVAALVSSAFLREPVYRIALISQLTFYGLGLLGMARLKRGLLARAADAAFTFVVLNTAAVVAFGNFVTGRKVAWSR